MQITPVNCIKKIIGGRLSSQVPPSEGKYQKYRTSQYRTFVSKNGTVYSVLLNTNKYLDSINRDNLLNDLKDVTEDVELHLMKLL